VNSNDRSVSIVAAVVGAVVLLAVVLGVLNASRPRMNIVAADSTTAQRVILISLDTLRQDHMSLYGYPRPTTPNIDKLAERAAVFTNAMSHAPFTLPSHMSMMTGVTPRTHDVRFFDDKLPESFATVAEVLYNAGFRTAAYTDGGLMRGIFGFGQGFETYADDRQPGQAWKNGFRRRMPQLREYIYKRKLDRFFLFFHTFDTHGPYVVEDEYTEALAGTAPVVPEGADAFGDPSEYIRTIGCHRYLVPEQYGTLAELIDTYDGTIRFVDDQVGKLIAFLEENDLFDDSLIIVTSDHGESFMDHHLYVGHGLTLYEEEVRVPLIVKFPGGQFAGERCDDVVRLIDLYPTICEAAGIVCPEAVEGEDLALALRGLDREPRVAFGVNPNLRAHGVESWEGSMSYVRRGDTKFIDPPKAPLEFLLRSHLHKPDSKAVPPVAEYDLSVDPLDLRQRTGVLYQEQVYRLDQDRDEDSNLAESRPRDVENIRAWIENAWSGAERTRQVMYLETTIADVETEPEIQAELARIRAELERAEELHQLGYISGDEFQRESQRLRIEEQGLKAKLDAVRAKAG